MTAVLRRPETKSIEVVCSSADLPLRVSGVLCATDEEAERLAATGRLAIGPGWRVLWDVRPEGEP